MGTIEDIASLLRKGPEMMSDLNAVKLNTKSVARGANEATFQFPCLISDTVPIDMANTIARTLDRKYAAYTQTWISLHPFMDISVDPTPMSYLRRLHQNLKLESGNIISDVEYKSMVDGTYTGETQIYMNEDQSFGVVFSTDNASTKSLLENNRELLRTYLSDFNLKPIVEADLDHTNSYDLAKAMIDNKAKQHDDEQRKLIMSQSDRMRAPQLVDREVKKTNDMIPFGIQVRLIGKNAKNEFVQYVDFIIGVKAILHPVKSDEIIENIKRALQNKSLSFKLLRWTTGEISLIKNIILDLDNVKMDVSSRNNGNPYFAALRRLKNRKMKVKDLTVPYALIPNTTICISSYEVDFMQNSYGIDLRNRDIVKKLKESLFLMSFIIIDEGTGTIDIYEDGSDGFQTYALETLERENSLNSNKLGREIGRMISH